MGADGHLKERAPHGFAGGVGGLTKSVLRHGHVLSDRCELIDQAVIRMQMTDRERQFDLVNLSIVRITLVQNRKSENRQTGHYSPEPGMK
jgi:hypothetical protein